MGMANKSQEKSKPSTSRSTEEATDLINSKNSRSRREREVNGPIPPTNWPTTLSPSNGIILNPRISITRIKCPEGNKRPPQKSPECQMIKEEVPSDDPCEWGVEQTIMQ